ncbi:MAG: helix-turn-helix transcriptional regulator [Variovorax sp.]
MHTHALAPAGAPIVLTPRETEVLDLIARGLTAKLIARQLGISPNTVRAHRDNLRRKLSVRNVAQLGYYRAAHPAD